MFELDVPEMIGGAKVICYIVLNLYLPTATVGPKTPFGYAICQYKANEGYYLFSCDDHWREFTDTWHETIEDAIDQADAEYPGILHNWITNEF